MKITFCMHQIITGGIEKSLIGLLEYLSSDCDWKFTIIAEKPVKEQIFLDFFRDKKIKVYVLENKNIQFDKRNTNFLLKFIYKSINKFYKKRKNSALKKYLAKSDLVIDYFNCSFCDLLKPINIPKIGWYHSGFAQYQKHLAEYNRKYSEVYDKLVVITKSFQSELDNNSCISNKIVQIYNPFNIAKIKEKAISASDYPKDETYFTFVGRFHEDKDHQTVIDAFEMIAPEYPAVKIYFIGDGDTKKHYEEIVKTKKLEKNIIFVGTLDNPFGYIKHATANILSSPSEGLSNVLVEGAILETLNVASDCPSGPAEILLDGKAGILYPVGDSKKLAQIMKDILTGKIDTNQMINNATSEIGRFDAKNIAKQFIKLCNRVTHQYIPTYYIVSGGFDPLHEGHIEMIKASAQASDGVIVLANSDDWLCRKKGKNFHSVKTRKSILANLKGVIDVLEFDDSDNSAGDGIRKVRAKYPEAHLVFANGGDRGKDNIPEGPVCKECKVELAFGVGGDNKANSSSWILNKWRKES